MRILQGIAASSGIGFGRAFVYIHEKLIVPHRIIKPQDIASEQRRFSQTLALVLEELDSMNASSEHSDHTLILETQQFMVQDPEFIKAVEQKIETKYMCAEWAVDSVMQAHIQLLEVASDASLRERSADLEDIGKRIIRNLMGKAEISLQHIGKQEILVADTLLPSEALSLNNTGVKAIALEMGGRTSHVAILARALQIPTVVGIPHITRRLIKGDTLIVDGNTGEVIVDPDRETTEMFSERKRLWKEHNLSLLNLAEKEAITTDGHTIMLKANIETVEEAALAIENGSQGVGLFRSEFLFMQTGGATEAQQFEAYKKVLQQFGETKPVTIRTIDVGGDKIIPGLAGFEEENPILGWRAIRFSLSQKQIFKVQLRALLRSSIYGKLNIMFPMISGPEELDHALEVLEEVKVELKAKEILFDQEVQVGIMIEVPSAALCSDLLAPKCDFFSIGTNDLIQYTIAVDRGNEKIAHLYQPFHPGVLRLLHMVVEKAHTENIPVAMCGEMAGDPLATLFLIGLGIDELSMSPQSLLEVKNIIRNVSLQEAQEFTHTILQMDSYVHIDTYVKEWMHETFGDIFPT
ncbi:MAG: phosphoenolpyruvate--protein phosphotransferase [Sphaerochaetaceae bacterium]|jgi:phosphotransferase system enzyme I (PtsI)